MLTETELKAYAPEAPKLKAVGESVRERLDQHPSIYKVPSDLAEVYALGDFMTPEECERMCKLIDACAKPSATFDQAYSEAHRTSYSGNVDPLDPFVMSIKRRTDDLLGIEERHGEALQGQRYLPGQEFKPHFDWFGSHGSYFEREIRRGGQRSYTAMIFLNEVEEGGTTDFPQLGISIEPKQGVLLAWNNARPDGQPNKNTLHAGRPVIKGVKYIVTQWYRTARWA